MVPVHIEGRVLRRGDYRYELHRREACWHAGVPERYPEVIVLANSEDDVAGAVQLAVDEGLQLAVRSGGHSWAASHLRDGTVLIDLSNLRHVSVDSEAMTGIVEPGIKGSELNAMLTQEQLFFPTGHCTPTSTRIRTCSGQRAAPGRGSSPLSPGFTSSSTRGWP
jgi:FAD/FMN-containing dehydrogenase